MHEPIPIEQFLPPLENLFQKSPSIVRQEWIEEAVRMFREHFAANWWTVPEKVRISVGFPIGVKDGKRKLGQCMHCIHSADSHTEIFLSPDHRGTQEVLETIAHELIHATVEGANPGPDYKPQGHKGKFKTCALAIGFKGPMTSTPADQKMLDIIKVITDKIGEFPAGVLSMVGRKKKATYLLKCECETCGYVARVTAKWIDQAGTPICPSCMEPMGEG